MSTATDKVAVAGLWHLGSVTSACLASLGHDVIGFDPDAATVSALTEVRPPVSEPGLAELIQRGLEDGALRFTSDAATALRGAKIVWITFDTPVDGDDRADADAVVAEVEQLVAHLDGDATLLVSSQLPVGTVRRLEGLVAAARPDASIGIACSPENLQLGRALDAFLRPSRVVVGVRSERDQRRIAGLLAPLGGDIVWMTPEAAEMSKHALNAWLATSIAFTNEVARLCEEVGADAGQVEQALRSEPRIGAAAYVRAGGAFSGGTLARDVGYLRQIGIETGSTTQLLDGVRSSNDWHAGWAERVLDRDLGTAKGRRIAVLGLTYKPGTDTLRRSASIELCRRLVARGAEVRAHDPAARELPRDLPVDRVPDVEGALRAANAVVVATPWPEYVIVASPDLLSTMAEPALVVDPTGLLAGADGLRGVLYRSVGTPR